MNKSLKTILHSSLIIGSTAIMLFGSIPFALSMIPVFTISTAKLIDDISNNDIKNSIFSVSKKGKISQNVLAKPTKLFKLFKKKDKNKAFLEEAANMFTQLRQKDKNGKIINYNTVSHAKTLFLLKKLKNNGYIENLNYEKKKKSSLFLEKLLIGNTNNLFNKRKIQMYSISFNITDKERRYDELINLENPVEKEENKELIKVTDDKSKIIEEKIRFLKNYKEELEQEKYNDKNDVIIKKSNL